MSPACRRQGIGEALAAKCEEYALNWGYDEIALTASLTIGEGPAPAISMLSLGASLVQVDERNTGAERLYSKLGYKTLWGGIKTTKMQVKNGRFYPYIQTTEKAMVKPLQRQGIPKWI